MSEETEALFRAMFALEDVRELLRSTAPRHKLSDKEKKQLEAQLATVERAIVKLKEVLKQ